ncbi:MAG: hypothetical protein P4L62_02895 [Candidatus Pacebacteria bacterium]|nr:hypothetical protein [Candidatus Paceibacterota bacterium]MDR3583281.1 hypothetical protein [Candidatus Paceibacterota bacterium]
MLKRLKKFFFPLFIFLVLPASTSYKLQDYSFGSGGTSGSSGGGFSLEAVSGEQGGGQASGGGFSLNPGMIFLGQANVPAAPTFSNPSSWYNKLNLVINPSGNPSDTKFAVAISTDNFATTQYVQSDDTVGPVLGAEDYQIYAAWGSGSGITVIGLAANTTYKVKVKAMQGKFSETGYGPTASATTSNPTLSFSVGTDDNPSTPPFSINFGSMTPGSVNTSPHQVNVGLTTNGVNGGMVYVYGANGGLYSAGANYKINAVTNANLAGLAEGFGAQGKSGGTLTLVAPYDVTSGDAVGTVDPTVRSIFSTAGPITGGTGSFLLKSKPATTAPAASDYTELLTVIAAGSF